MYASSCFKNLGKKVRMFAFDSFEGCPEVNDDDIPEHWKKGGFMRCLKKEFVHNIQTHGINMENVIIVEGFYKDSLTADLSAKYNIKKVLLYMLIVIFMSLLLKCWILSPHLFKTVRFWFLMIFLL